MKSPAPKRTLEITPRTLRRGDALTVRGAGWGGCLIEIRIDGEIVRGLHVATGYAGENGVRPDAHGELVAIVPTLGLEPGEHRAETGVAGKKPAHSERIEVLEREEEEDDGEEGGESPFGRESELWGRRFSHAGFVPSGMLAARRRDLDRLRWKPPHYTPLDRIITPGCNWTPVGPGAGYITGSGATAVYSGKIRAIAIDPVTPSTVYAGASGGGVWKTTDSGATWTPKSDYQTSLAIGAIAIDPNDHLHIVAGTGVDMVGYMDYYGAGVIVSTDGGDSWTEHGGATFDRATISRIVFDPTDATGQRLLLSSSLGVYASSDGGSTWTSIFAGTISDLVLVAGGGGSLTALAGVRFQGISRSTRATATSAWPAFTSVSSTAFSTSVGRVVLGQCAQTPATVYAAFETFSGGNDLGVIVRTNDGGGTWAAVGNPASPSSQVFHAFHLTVHPVDPNIVCYGEVWLWRTTTGGAPWTNVSGPIHADQNACAFDPVTPAVVWAGNDGGIWRSSDTGATWSHRNNGLATFKCVRGAQHPQWDSVFLISTQDTGAFRGDGQPVWPMLSFGDTGPLGIDPYQPRSYFVGGYHDSVARSDTAGQSGSFVDKTGAITGQSLFYAPFTVDANAAGVCYFGSDRLWRSANHGDTWVAITAVLVNSFDPVTGAGNALSAIAPHPTDPNLVYAGCSDGQVFRVRRTGATWTVPDVTTTNLTAAPLPVGVSISSLTVDGTGALWAGVGSVLYPLDVGEFINDHVFRYDTGAGTWSSRSSGLAVANPVNAIVADLAASTTLYCGADSGVFRTTDGMTWMPWDDGLPEAPVFDLVLHAPRRLLRAVTHGRSVWERSLDATVCPATDLYLRDDLLDTGRVVPSPSGVADPFEAGVTDYWYQSDDIKVDGPAPDYQTPSVILDFINFEAVLQHTSPRRGVVNRFYARVQNRGPLAATNVKLRAFFADAHAGLPPLPMNFWTGLRPFDADPTATDWAPIGPRILVNSVAPGMPAIVEWDWPVPLTANDHSCLLLLATSDQEPLTGGGVLIVDSLVPGNKQVTLKNMHVENAVPGLPRPPHGAMFLKFYNWQRDPARYDLVIDWSTLPVETELHLAFEKWKTPVLAATKQELERAGATRTDDGGRFFPKSVEGPCESTAAIDPEGMLRLRRPKNESHSIIPVLLPSRRSMLVLVNPVLPKGSPAGAYRFDIQQWSGKRLVGGSTYELHASKEGKTDRKLKK